MKKLLASAALDLCRALVRTPSQAGVDSTNGVVNVVSRWLASKDVPFEAVKTRSGRTVGILINPPSSSTKGLLLLNACLDTALAGDPAQWTIDPFEAELSGGWLYGRGAADSKAAVAIFCSLAAHLGPNGLRRNGNINRHVSIFFDCDEHSGRFSGIKRYVQRYGYPENCVIGYPGNDKIVVGSRGFYRTVVTVRGTLAHAGSAKPVRESAVDKLALLIQGIGNFSPAHQVCNEYFPLPPKGSITAIDTGTQTFTVTASRILVSLDIRLTPEFGPREARDHIRNLLGRIEQELGGAFPPIQSTVTCWPAFRTREDCLLVQLLDHSAHRVLGRTPAHQISGPSNIGNFLAESGANVVAGFGVTYRDIHAPNECIEVGSLEPVHDVYVELVSRYLASASEV